MEGSSTSKAQKIGIWIIIIAMAVGSVGAYFAIILANDNQKIDQTNQQKFQKQIEEQQKQAKAAAEAEAKKTKQPLDGYEATPFDKASVSELAVENLQTGSGKAADEKSTVTVNYFGWTSDGVIFDSSKKDGQVTPVTFPLNGVIKGWTEGLKGVKEGSVVRLTIPANKAYGPQGKDTIGPNEPLQFIVVLEKVK